MMYVAPISTRNQFGCLLNELGLTGQAVEIGTHRADFAADFLYNWRGQKLLCVDPWKNPPGYEYQAARLWGGAQTRYQDYEQARLNLAPYKGRAVLFMGTSEQAKAGVADSTLDFVHLDGDHTEPAVTQDITWWWPKLKPGGILAGHDIVCPGEPDGLWGRFIQPAVLKFASVENVHIQLVVEEGGQPWSYYLIKPGVR